MIRYTQVVEFSNHADLPDKLKEHIRHTMCCKMAEHMRENDLIKFTERHDRYISGTELKASVFVGTIDDMKQISGKLLDIKYSIPMEYWPMLDELYTMIFGDTER